ncbi:polysaccharide biosynthesis protein [Rhizobium sp. TRM95111]|uniref:ATP-grasp fold amidoligase family protein n=1 Tax=Rhizobium alarense TaxID=2846851 RepID=UPI001F392904|nr:ATP-grasp fold amidoligase family protein [Rhizobium alarense]MCF3639665.1 polysaccharide biosynthesis protein [Rhizobium alarense]
MQDETRRETFLIPGYQDRTVKEMVRHAIWRVIAPLPDRPYLAIKYRVIKGVWPSFRNPRTFSEKVQARKLYDRNPLYGMLVDKAGVKAYVDAKLGPGYAIPQFWVGTDLGTVDWSRVELPVVVKPTHASAQGRFLYGRGDIDRLVADNPVPHWLTLDHSGFNREWAYSQVKPQVVIEAMLQVEGGIPWDYRFHTFGGEVSHVEINMRIGDRGYACHYSPDWQKLPLWDPDYLPRYPGEVARPKRLDEMLMVARTLGADLDFVRVDLYASDDWVRVGELTLYPGGGFEHFDPPEYDRIIGDRWTLGFSLPS